jgi:hypothetical protein
LSLSRIQQRRSTPTFSFRFISHFAAHVKKKGLVEQRRRRNTRNRAKIEDSIKYYQLFFSLHIEASFLYSIISKPSFQRWAPIPESHSTIHHISLSSSLFSPIRPGMPHIMHTRNAANTCNPCKTFRKKKEKKEKTKTNGSTHPTSPLPSSLSISPFFFTSPKTRVSIFYFSPYLSLSLPSHFLLG